MDADGSFVRIKVSLPIVMNFNENATMFEKMSMQFAG